MTLPFPTRPSSDLMLFWLPALSAWPPCRLSSSQRASRCAGPRYPERQRRSGSLDMRGLFDGHQPGQKGEDGIAPADPVSERERDRVIHKQASVGLEPDAECPGEHGDGHHIEQVHSIVEAGRQGLELEMEQQAGKGDTRGSNAQRAGPAENLRSEER